LDGIISPEDYLKAKYKILWILKEPYDEVDENGKPYGGGWDMKEVLDKKKSISEFKGDRRTFQRMIYTSYSILNNFSLWVDIPNIETPEVFNTLKSISYINVKKMPGYSSSVKSVIKKAYDENREILFKQIQIGEPDIIIGGGTLDLFLSDLGFTNKDLNIRESGSFPYYIKKKQLFIGAYHPSYLSIDEETYCNDIINTIKFVAEDISK
jgi:hypothetical protein